MPGVAALVGRGGRHPPVRQAPAPVRLAFQLRPVAKGALLRVDCCARLQVRSRPRCVAAGHKERKRRHTDRECASLEHAQFPRPRWAIGRHDCAPSVERYTLLSKVAIAYSPRATGFCAMYATASSASCGSLTSVTGPAGSAHPASRALPSKRAYHKCLPSRSKNTAVPWPLLSAIALKLSPASRDR